MDNYNNKLFSWGKSYYRRYYDKHKKLAPNIAVYCKSPHSNNLHYNDLYYKDDRNKNAFNENNKWIHIINCIVYAFDNNKQPDYKELLSLREIYSEDIINNIYQDRYYNILELYFFVL